MIRHRGERILAVRDPGSPPQTTEIDCTGKFAVPGLFDCHTHLAHLTLQEGDSLREALSGFVAHGVLHVRDVGGPIGALAGLSRKTASGELPGPDIFYTGPMLESSPLTWEKVNEELPGFTVAIDTEADADSLLPELARQGACMIKTFNRIDASLYRHLVDIAHRCSLRVVHDPGTPLFHWMPMDAALDLGVTSFEHAKAPWPVVLEDDLRAKHDAVTGPNANPMGQMRVMSEAVERGVEALSPERIHDLAARMVAKDAYLCPTLHVFVDMGDDDAESGSEDDGAQQRKAMMKKVMGAMDEVSRHLVSEFSAAGVKLLVGQDGCDPAATWEETRHLKECGVSEAEILKGATIYPARWLGVEDRFGSIAEGRTADIVILDADPLESIDNLRAVFLIVRRGRPL